MIVVCSISEDNNSIVKIELLEGGKSLYLCRCEQNNFCEQLPAMVNDIAIFLKKKYNKNCKYEIEYKTDFDVKKHLTTYRIFNSFVVGFTTDA